MSRDLAIMKMLDDIIPTGLEFVDGNPPVLQINSSGFSNIEGIYINGYRVKEWFQQSSKRIIAQLPEEVLGTSLKGLTILSYDFTFNTPKSRIRWNLGRRSRFYTGLLKLMQNFLFRLLQTPGSDVFDPGVGGGLLAIVGRSGTGKNTVTSAVTAGINSVQNYFRQRQASENIPNEEKLLYARLKKIGFSAEETAVDVTIELTNMAGTAGAMNVSQLTEGFK